MAVAYQNTHLQLLLKACLHKQLLINIEELFVIKNSKEVSIYQSKLCIDTKNF